jgi:hypothetical protein
MNSIERFTAYAADFEKTLVDDDWSRLDPWFHDDAIYRVEGGDLFGCELEGRERIFAGMKKSLDGFDRKFESRSIELEGAPEVDGDEIRLVWKVTYHSPDWPDYVLPGRSMVHYRDGRIALLVDTYDPDRVAADLADWTRETGVELDPSYT